MSALTKSKKLSTAHVVRRPRAVDGIGSALRDAFSPDGAALPADMRALLCTLESRSQPR
jgi:hypothetical protein